MITQLSRAAKVLEAPRQPVVKDEFKRRGLAEVAGREFTVTDTEQIAGRLDVKAVKERLATAA